jgi:putative transcriptional regulator
MACGCAEKRLGEAQHPINDGANQYDMPEKTTIVRYEPRRGQRSDAGTDWERVDALTDDDVEAAALFDPDCPPLTPEQASHMRRGPNVRQSRKGHGLSQVELAERFAIPVSAVRDWEQGRYSPPAAAITLLNVIEHNPDAVVESIDKARQA